MTRRLLFVLLAICMLGCTRWAVTPVYGQRSEVARRLYGAPQIEQTSSADVSAGFDTYGES